MTRISILTSTYNRAEKLKRLYHSLTQSTYKDFEWVIMNDGSEDDTENVVKSFQTEAQIPIRYYRQTNSGKHVAFNRLYELAQGEYCFPMDDDDELLPDAMERGLAIWDDMSEEYRKGCWCVCGLCIEAKTRKIVGKPFVENINELPDRKRKKAISLSDGERCGMQKVEIVRQYKFPEIEGCNYFPEGNIWRRINEDYRQYYTNDIFRVYYIQDGESLINYAKTKSSYERRYRLYKYLLSEENRYKSPFFSRRHIAEIYKYRLFAEKIGINKHDIYEGIALRNQICVCMFAIPYRFIRVIKHD